ncbi:MAG TPA: lipid-binding SYLF domain-containing protein [Verrucomicrobiales bacterium]|nr:lipid-binding SYLF domain-containing protein [Verrucomicrobiales bacterium]
MKLTPLFRLLIAIVIFINPAPLISFAGPFEKSAEKLDLRIRRAAERFIEMQAEPKKRIPAELLSRAQGIIILHQVKAGLGIGGEAGNGVALLRNKTTGAWSAPAFISSAEGSYGLQIGAQESDIIFLLMNESALKPLLGGSINVGVDVAATAGPIEEGGDFDTTTLKSPILVYSNSGGLFAGAAFKGGGILPAKKNNELYYGRNMNDVLFDPALRPSATGQHLIDVIETYSGRRKN